MKRARDEASEDAASADRRKAVRQHIPRDAFNFHPASVNVNSIRSLVLELIFGGKGFDARKYSGEKAELPGPLPISLNRKYLSVVETHPYMVCEKSDGERAMLLLLSSSRAGVPPGAYLLNRAFEPMTFSRAEEYASMLAANGPTLLEGELLQRGDDAGTGTGALAVFMMFDCVWLNGRDVAGANLPARLQAVGEGIRVPFRLADDKALAEGRARLPLYLAGKFMVDKRATSDILAKVTEVGHGHMAGADAGAGAVIQAASSMMAPLESEMGRSATGGSGASRVYRDGIRVNGTDGLIFTPTMVPYRDLFAGTSLFAPLLKWKYGDENTVDFSMKPDHLQAVADAAPRSSGGQVETAPVPLAVSVGARDDLPLTNTLLTREAAAAYLALCDRVGRGALIVEAGFDTVTSSWVIRRVRDRKTRSNFVRTAWSTLEVVAEGITQDEIIGRLSGSMPR